MSLFDDNEAMRAAINDDAEIGELREKAMLLVASVDELHEGTAAQRIGKLLRDENGLPLTQASLAVLVTVLLSIDRTDEQWGQKSMPGTPSVTDYAIGVRRMLDHRYLGDR